MHPSEQRARWRGYHILEALARDIRRETPWEPLNPPAHSKPTRGMYDPTHGWYDQDAGPKERIEGPKLAILTIPALDAIGYAGEDVTMTPTWMRFRILDLHRHSLWIPVREYARGDATYRVAAYWPSRQQVSWSNAAPHALREAALVLADAVPRAQQAHFCQPPRERELAPS